MNDRELQLYVLQLAVIAGNRSNFNSTHLSKAFNKISLKNFSEVKYPSNLSSFKMLFSQRGYF